MRRLHDRHDIVDGGLAFPFDDGYEVEFARARELLKQEILHEALLQTQQFMRRPDLAQYLLAGVGRDDELIDPETASLPSF
ncbi:hypothetical protein AJ88_29440 [Mesorhizobium amorphae CCBAU 01583]|nr:hypothetical protein AJ88_29440 [Mesorhizobium amorphae CCBAU 01583]